MHSKVDESTEDIIEYEVRGKLAGKELAAIARYGKIRLLISMPEIPRPDLAAFGEEISMAQYTDNIERYTGVGNGALLE